MFEGYSLSVGWKEFQRAEGRPAFLSAIHASKNPATFTAIIEDTAALVGLAIAFTSTLLDQLLGWHLADGLASIVIGVTLAFVAILLVVESKALLVGEGADISTLRTIPTLAQEQPGVEVVGYPLTMYFGPGNILLTINIRFTPTLDRDGIQDCVDRIESAVRGRFPQVHHIYVEGESLRTSQKWPVGKRASESDLPLLPQ